MKLLEKLSSISSRRRERVGGKEAVSFVLVAT